MLERLKNQHVVPKPLLSSGNYAIVTLDEVSPGWCQDTMRWKGTWVVYHLLERTFLEMLTEANPLRLPTPTSSNDVPQEIFRALIGWAPEQWSVQARSSLISAIPEQHLRAVLTCKAQVTKRPAFTPTNPITEIDENDLVRTIKARPEYAYVETEVTNAGGSCRLAIVNLEEVLAFQPLVRVDHLETRQVQESLDDEGLYELCFPASRPISADEVTIEPDNNGYTITTLDPNIRMFPWHGIPGVPAERAMVYFGCAGDRVYRSGDSV